MTIRIIAPRIHSIIFSSGQGMIRQTGLPHCRFFFASSTDHTRLLAEAQVHRWVVPPDSSNNNNNNASSSTQYVLAAHGMDLEMVKKVPQLHLARLFLTSDSGTMNGAKVVNRTLGDPAFVCGKLVDAALQDGATLARSTLHGLSDHVLQQASLSSDGRLVTLARGKNLAYGNDDEIATNWETLARDFISSRQCLETNLHMDKGGTL
eukprot:scaffold5296_cov163-Amphora_coffeaeformis.AAC.16